MPASTAVPSKNLEYSFSMPEQIVNELEVAEGDKKVVYVARAHSLWLNGFDIRGGLSITKYEIRHVTERERVGWFSKKFETIEKDVRRQIWHFEDDNGHRSRYLISQGSPARDKNCAADCETKLVGAVASGGVLLSRRLLDDLLGPIYSQLLEIYRTVEGFYSRGVVGQ